MADIMNGDDLEAWLKGKPPELACVLAARVALRVVPVLQYALHEMEEDRRCTIVLLSFRALAAVNCAATWPTRGVEIRNAARGAACDAGDAMADIGNAAQMSAFEARDAIPDMDEYVWRLEGDARALGIANRAVDAAAHAVQAVVDAVDAAKGIAGLDAVYKATVDAAVAAHRAVDGVHGNSEFFNFFNESEKDDEAEANIAEHIAEFWKAVRLDVECLESGTSAGDQPEVAVSGLSERALWLDGTPVWAGRQWADLKDRLPEKERWWVWIDWYEARLVGRVSDANLEFDRVKIPKDDWERGPAHVNAIIARMMEARTDPLLAAVSRGFEELDAVRQVTSIDLTRHKDRIRDALPKDPYQAIGATKDMLEATMKTILRRRGDEETDNIDFSELTSRCLSELGLRGTSPPATEGERHLRKIASSAQRMIETANELRNLAGTGHGRVVGEEPVIAAADAGLVASTGLILAAWLLHHDVDA